MVPTAPGGPSSGASSWGGQCHPLPGRPPARGAAGARGGREQDGGWAVGPQAPTPWGRAQNMGGTPSSPRWGHSGGSGVGGAAGPPKGPVPWGAAPGHKAAPRQDVTQ
ncbi:PREDICTED: cuticle collagen 2-like [Tinamus guttatus]|uniref:cuticle collagen 2-like n=1 Tax=Tinamus guttatus TaxID=94827 RepID=UPI00052ECB49|nr:PREDICTED: cuticle collagen 2-like [Tinamus guttatus]